MKIQSIQLPIGLLLAAVVCAQNPITLKYSGYEPGYARLLLDAPCSRDAWNLVSDDANGFTVAFGWTCRETKASTVAGSVRVEFSPLVVSASSAGSSNQIFTFSPAIQVTVTANYTVSSAPVNAEIPTLSIVTGVPWSGRLFTTYPSCARATVTPGNASLSCSVKGVSGANDTTGPPIYLGAYLWIPSDTGSALSRAGEVDVFGKFSPCSGTDCGSGAPPKFDHIDVIQVVPVTDPATNELILVPNKSTVARVFGTANAPTKVDVALTSLDRSGGPIHLPLTLGPGPLDTNKPAQSADFPLPMEWTTQGKLTLQAQFQPAQGPPVNSDPKVVLFKFAPNWPAKYIVWSMPVCEILNIQTPLCGAPLGDLAGFMRKILPVSELFRTEHWLRQPLRLQPYQLTGAILREKLAWIWLELIARLPADEAPDLLVAWVPSAGVIKQTAGKTTAIYNTLVQLLGIDHWISYFPDSPDLWTEQVVLASVVAKQLGADMYALDARGHEIGITGYDPVSMSVKPSFSDALSTHVVSDMWIYGTKASADIWISPEQYLSLYNAFPPKSTGSSQLAPRTREAHPATASQSPYLLITGTVQADGSAGTFSPGFLTVSSNAPPASDPSGNFCLHFSSASAALGDYCFQASFQDVTGAAIQTGMFAVQAPFPSGTTRVSLIANSGANKGTELTAIDKSAAAPTVQINSPHSGDRLDAGQINITWTGSAAGGAALTYNLSYSADGGTTWTPLDVMIAETQYQLDATQIAGGSQVMFQVDASDGLNTGTAVVGPLTINQTPKISLPASPLNCGKALPGTSMDQMIPIGNTGTGLLTITAGTLDNSAFRWISPALPFTINAGGSQNIDVRFTPATTGVQQAVLSIASSSDPAHPISITLSGEGITTPVPVVRLATQSLDCGSAPVGASADGTLSLSNPGSATLTVNDAKSSNPMFSVTAPVPPFTVANHAQQSITVHFAPTATGAQSATLTLSTDDPSAPTVTVPLTGTGTAASGGNPPQIKAGGILNAASYTTPLARGSLAAIFGTNLSTSTAQASGLPWGTTLGGSSVTVGGVPAPVYYVSPTQVNFQVPYEVPAGSSTNVVVTSGGVPSAATPVALADYAVGVFTYARTATSIDPIVVHYSNNQLVTPTSPAAPGEVLVVYGTGVGKLNNPPRTGFAAPASPLATPVDPITMTLGAAPVTMLFAGLTPGLAGMLQMNIQLPVTLPAGSSLPMVVQFLGGTSPAVNLAVQGSLVSGPKLTLSTNALAFDSVTVGQDKDLSVTVSGAGFSMVPPISAFTVQPGGALPITVRYTPASATSASGTLTIASNDSSSPAIVTLTGTGVATGPTPGTVLVSDSFNRADATGCALGKADLALGGSGSHYYLPTNSTTGVSIVSGALQNNTLDYAGVQLSASGSCSGRGETLLQDLYMRVDLLVPASPAGVVQAGPYFRSRAAGPGDGIIGGTSAGYWVTLTSTGEVRLRGLNPNAVIASTGVPSSFNATVFHTLEAVAQGSALQVWLDGALLTFTQNGVGVTRITLPATTGSNDGAAGIAFADEDNRGKAGGQRAKNLVIAQLR